MDEKRWITFMGPREGEGDEEEDGGEEAHCDGFEGCSIVTPGRDSSYTLRHMWRIDRIEDVRGRGMRYIDVGTRVTFFEPRPWMISRA